MDKAAAKLTSASYQDRIRANVSLHGRLALDQFPLLGANRNVSQVEGLQSSEIGVPQRQELTVADKEFAYLAFL